MGRFRKFRSKVEKKLEPFADQIADDAAMRIRMDGRILRRWMDYSGAETPAGIDYSNPCVYIEWCAADLAVLNMAEDAEKFIERTGCDRETFMRYYWPGSGPDA